MQCLAISFKSQTKKTNTHKKIFKTERRIYIKKIMENFNFSITPELIKNAVAYVPLSKKMAYVKAYAPVCVEKAQRNDTDTERDKLLALPQICIDNQFNKELLSLDFFLTEYFGIDLGGELNAENYDKFLSSHLFEQLERLKEDKTLTRELKNKIYDILADYKKFKKLFDTEIYSVKENYNNSLDRIIAGISVIMKPETAQKLIDELQKIEQAEKEKKQQQVKE